jgi:hypothetical protein
MVRRCRAYPSYRAPFSLLLPAIAFAAPAHKRHSRHWNYGFPPGYQHRPTTTFRSMARGERSAAQPAIRRATGMVARYYFGNPGFLSRPLHGCSFGPCWTITCIGRVWNPPGPEAATREPPEGGFPSLGSAPEGRSILYFTFRDPLILQPPYKTFQAINSPNLQRSIGVCKQRVSSIGLWRRAFTGALFQEPTVTSIG